MNTIILPKDFVVASTAIPPLFRSGMPDNTPTEEQAEVMFHNALSQVFFYSPTQFIFFFSSFFNYQTSNYGVYLLTFLHQIGQISTSITDMAQEGADRSYDPDVIYRIRHEVNQLTTIVANEATRAEQM